MPIEGVTVTKIKNYSIPEWARKENLNEMFNLSHAINIIDWKMSNKVPRGEAGCK
jgi:hypothetical protein